MNNLFKITQYKPLSECFFNVASTLAIFALVRRVVCLPSLLPCADRLTVNWWSCRASCWTFQAIPPLTHRTCRQTYNFSVPTLFAPPAKVFTLQYYTIQLPQIERMSPLDQALFFCLLDLSRWQIEQKNAVLCCVSHWSSIWLDINVHLCCHNKFKAVDYNLLT